MPRSSESRTKVCLINQIILTVTLAHGVAAQNPTATLAIQGLEKLNLNIAKIRSVIVLIPILFPLIIGGPIANAQTSTATLSGQVTDEHRAVISGVTVSA